MFIKYFFLLLVSSLTIFSTFGQKDIIPASTNKLVNNFSKAFPDFFSQQEQKLLEQKLENFAAATSNQMYSAIIANYSKQFQYLYYQFNNHDYLRQCKLDYK